MNFRGLSQRVLLPVLWLCLSGFWPCEGVRAQPSSLQRELVAAYSTAPGCPERAEFERRVRARLGAGEGLNAGRRFDIRFTHGAGGARARLELVGHETGSVRELSAPSCDEAADALALVAALMLRDLAQPRVSGPAVDHAHAHGTARAAGRPQDSEGSSVGGAAAAQGEPSDSRVANPVADAPESARESAETVARTREAAQPAESAPVPHAPDAPFFSKPQLAFSLAGLAAFRVAPHVRPGLGLALSLSALTRAGPRLGVMLGARATLPDLIRTDDGRAQFVWAAGTGALCVEGPERRVRVSGCGVLELGGLRASGAAATGHARSRFWGALGPSLAGSVVLHPRVALRLSGELLGILLRDRFRLADRVLFSVPKLAFRTELGLWVTIW